MPYVPSPYFKTPADADELWKYMHIDKFMSMLSNESLYFPNIYQFDDKYEGTLTKQSKIEVRKTSLLDNNTPINLYEVLNKRKDIIKEFPNDKKRAELLMSLYSFEALLNVFSNHLMFCNCWFIKSEESHAMWAEYGDKIPTSIAIQTTVSNFKKSFDMTDYRIHIGRVKYKDYEKDHIKGYEEFALQDLTDPAIVLKLFYAPVMHKRRIYNDEREVRAIISFENIYKKYLKKDYTTNIPFFSEQLFDIDTYYKSPDDHESDLTKDIRDGEPVNINIKTLIQKVVIPPNANTYFEKPLKELLAKQGIDPKKVERSKIRDKNR